MKTSNYRSADDQASVAMYKIGMSNAVNKPRHSAERQRKAVSMRDALEDCYDADSIDLTYVKKWISITIRGSRGVKNPQNLKFLQEGWALEGIAEPMLSAAGHITYRVTVA